MRLGVHPGGNAEDFENKRVAGKAIRKTMKTKGRQEGEKDNAPFEAQGEESQKAQSRRKVGHPTPGVLPKECGFA